ncbi:iron chelate uptake ABC transporter family permease subunit [Nakamurella sp.]|uniref:iron chelate uptake ABC transporter family permease subunit n=1 Tax=Nakamurella sp. TaxID=1869182 RepID=UPI003B3A30AD
MRAHAPVVAAPPRGRRVAPVAAVGLVLLAAGSLAALCWGTPALGVGPMVRALGGDGDRLVVTVVNQLRAPRVVAAITAGAALAVAGTLLQAVLHNRLATPDLLGVGPGAAVAVAAVVVFGLPVPGAAFPVVATAGAAAGGAITLAAARGLREPSSVLLAGAAVGAALGALVVSVTSMAEQLQVQLLFRYLSGSLAAVTWAQVTPMLAWTAVSLLAALALAPWLSVLVVGDRTAGTLGLPVYRVRRLAVAVAVLLVAGAVSVAGPIAWIGFLGPLLVHLVLPGVGVVGRVPLSALAGALVTVAADLAARLAFAPVESPVGAWTAVVGIALAVTVVSGRLGAARDRAAAGEPARADR